MTEQPSLSEMVGSHRVRNTLLVVGPFVALGAIWMGLSSQGSENAADIRQLGQTSLAVARMDTEIEYIKAGIERVEKSGDERHRQTLQALSGIEQELRFIRVKTSPSVPATIKGMMPNPLSSR